LAAGECVIPGLRRAQGHQLPGLPGGFVLHFEAYAWRRKTMNALAKRYMRLTGMSRGAKRAGCGAGGCGCAAGDCAGCGSRGGCPAARLAEKLAEVLAAG